MPKPMGYWTKKRCINVAKKCKTRTEFNRNYQGAWRSAKTGGWLNKIFEIIPPQGSRKFRKLYVYIFSDNHVYVGLTYNIKNRNKKHFEYGPVYNHMKKTNLIPDLVELTNFIPVTEASQLEIILIKNYEKVGFNLLNRGNYGGVGGGDAFWSKERCKKEALKYKHKIDLINSNESVYRISKRNGWLDEITKHMIRPDPWNKKWTKEKCKEEALKYKSRGEFRNKSNSAYVISCNKKWLDEICFHMN